jgi:hypothetical protein
LTSGVGHAGLVVSDQAWSGLALKHAVVVGLLICRSGSLAEKACGTVAVVVVVDVAVGGKSVAIWFVL